MDDPAIQPLTRHAIDAADLLARFPPRLECPRKRLLLSIACPADAVHVGTIHCSRWPPGAVPCTLGASEVWPRIVSTPGYYSYEQDDGPERAMTWHVNFADPRLFFGYGTSLFAQDEIQVAEHPALGSLREALLVMHGEARTSEAGHPTPVLVAGVQRHCAIGLSVEPSDGLPNIYGRAFGSAPEPLIRRAVRRLKPPTVSNIIAMAAPSCGSGAYDAPAIERVLRTACTAFAAAVHETRRLSGPGSSTVIHTGHWGCGAFGGNRELMAALQVVAAALTSCDEVVFHAGDTRGIEAFRRSQSLLDSLRGVLEKGSTTEVVQRLATMGYRWGVSDGN